MNFSCFASFDFTPEDVFLSTDGLKYVDPKKSLLGIPIIDMACFGGVAKDAFALPGPVEGYDILKNFAINDISSLLKIDKTTAEAIFYLGRALQMALSSRFRLKTEADKSHQFFEKSCGYCRKIERLLNI